MIVFAKGWPIPAETFKRIGVVYGGVNGDFRNAENIARVTNDVVEIVYEAGCTDEQKCTNEVIGDKNDS